MYMYVYINQDYKKIVKQVVFNMNKKLVMAFI